MLIEAVQNRRFIQVIKEIADFLISYPMWVKLAVIVLGAGILFLLIAFRPSTPSPPVIPSAVHVFRIDRIEAKKPYKLISLNLNINGETNRFPSGYEFAAFEQSMKGGEYRLPTNSGQFDLVITIKAQLDEIPFGSSTPTTITKELRSRQSIHFFENQIPKSDFEDFRPVDFGAQGTLPGYEIRISYSVN
jgi:hypothetical protein